MLGRAAPSDRRIRNTTTCGFIFSYGPISFRMGRANDQCTGVCYRTTLATTTTTTTTASRAVLPVIIVVVIVRCVLLIMPILMPILIIIIITQEFVANSKV